MNKPDTDDLLQGGEGRQLQMRQALPEDVLDVLRWRNDPLTCAMSRQHDAIEETVHRSWYAKALNDSSRLLVLGILKGQKVGIVRFDHQRLLSWEVSITLSPEARGMGIGRHMLEMALQRLYAVHPSAKVLAVARAFNKRSLNLFQSLGFKKESEDGEFVSLVLYSKHPGSDIKV